MSITGYGGEEDCVDKGELEAKWKGSTEGEGEATTGG